jgi:hypothetical protein
MQYSGEATMQERLWRRAAQEWAKMQEAAVLPLW